MVKAWGVKLENAVLSSEVLVREYCTQVVPGGSNARQVPVSWEDEGVPARACRRTNEKPHTSTRGRFVCYCTRGAVESSLSMAM
jgi:hypothetical protein